MIESMLEKAIEIEGLIRIIRDGNPMPETYQILCAKIAVLAEEAEGLERSEVRGRRSEDFEEGCPDDEKLEEESLEEESVDAESLEEGSADNGDLEEENLDKDDILEESLEEENLDKENIAADNLEVGNPENENIVIGEEDEILLNFEIDEEEISEIKDQRPDGLDRSEVRGQRSEVLEEEGELKFVEVEEEKLAEKPKVVEQIKRKESKLRSAFSLNDRFLYSRELFEGNMKMFDSTLDFLEGIEDYSIIEDYFYSEMEWDPENRYVASFMDILRPHFRE